MFIASDSKDGPDKIVTVKQIEPSSRSHEAIQVVPRFGRNGSGTLGPDSQVVVALSTCYLDPSYFAHFALSLSINILRIVPAL